MNNKDLPNTGFLRLTSVLKMIPISRTSWYEGIISGMYPKPIKLSARASAWRVEDIRELIQKLGAKNEKSN